jgi:hypothetical protein
MHASKDASVHASKVNDGICEYECVCLCVCLHMCMCICVSMIRRALVMHIQNSRDAHADPEIHVYSCVCVCLFMCVSLHVYVLCVSMMYVHSTATVRARDVYCIYLHEYVDSIAYFTKHTGNACTNLCACVCMCVYDDVIAKERVRDAYPREPDCSCFV